MCTCNPGKALSLIHISGIQKDADQIAQAAQRIMAANSVGSRNAEIARQADVILKTVSHLSE